MAVRSYGISDMTVQPFYVHAAIMLLMDFSPYMLLPDVFVLFHILHSSVWFPVKVCEVEALVHDEEVVDILAQYACFFETAYVVLAKYEEFEA